MQCGLRFSRRSGRSSEMADKTDNMALLAQIDTAISSNDIAEMKMALCLAEAALIGNPLSTARPYTLEEMRDGREST